MGSSTRSSSPGLLIGLLGVAAIVGGFATGGPDVVGGIVFGSVALAAAAVMLRRRSNESKHENARTENKPDTAPEQRDI